MSYHSTTDLKPKLSCLRFPSLFAMEEFVRLSSPYVVEELDTILCGVFTENQLELAAQYYQASALVRK